MIMVWFSYFWAWLVLLIQPFKKPQREQLEISEGIRVRF
jgi:hypothetical protein